MNKDKVLISGIALFRFSFSHMSGSCDFYIRARDGREFHGNGVGCGNPRPGFLDPFFEAMFDLSKDVTDGLTASQLRDHTHPFGYRLYGWNIAPGWLTEADVERMRESGCYYYPGSWSAYGRHTRSEYIEEYSREMREIADNVLSNFPDIK